MGLQINQLKKKFGDVRALDGISFQVNDGNTFGLLGRNGAGKTTTIRILLGITDRDSGDVLIDGQDIKKTKTQFGYLPEERGLYLNYTVSDQILYLAKMHGVSKKEASARLRDLLERFGIPDYYGKKVKELSKGNKQKIQLIAALIHDPDVVILDEPFSGLDPVNIQAFKDIVLELKHSGKTIVFSSHRMEDIEEICDSIILLKNGREVLSGTVPEIKSQFSDNTIEIRTDDDIENYVAANDMAFSGAVNGVYRINYKNEKYVQSLLRQLVENKVSIKHFEFKYPSLHEIFLSQLGN